MKNIYQSSSESDSFSGSLSNSDSPMLKSLLPWIPEPSTGNNKLKRREGYRICTKTTNSILWLARFNQIIFPLNQSLRDVSIYYLLSKALESRVSHRQSQSESSSCMYYWSYWSSKISDVLFEFQLEHNKHRVGSLVPLYIKFFLWSDEK
jgi:hypothetical protein